jgi:ABC-2 type transport system permease protein
LLIFGTGLSASLRGIGGGLGGAPSINYVQFIYPGIIGMAVLFTAIFSAMSIVWDREFGFLKEVLVAPIDRSAIAIGKALGGSTQAMVQGMILLVLAPIVGVTLTPLAVLELIPLIFVLAFALTTLGVVLASGMKSMQGFQAVMNFLMMPIFFLSGALFPLSNLPWWMTALTRIDPAAYGIDPIRRVILGASGIPAAVTDRLALTVGGQTLPTLAEVGLVLGFGTVMLAIAIWNLRRPA